MLSLPSYYSLSHQWPGWRRAEQEAVRNTVHPTNEEHCSSTTQKRLAAHIHEGVKGMDRGKITASTRKWHIKKQSWQNKSLQHSEGDILQHHTSNYQGQSYKTWRMPQASSRLQSTVSDAQHNRRHQYTSPPFNSRNKQLTGRQAITAYPENYHTR